MCSKLLLYIKAVDQREAAFWSFDLLISQRERGEGALLSGVLASFAALLVIKYRYKNKYKHR